MITLNQNLQLDEFSVDANEYSARLSQSDIRMIRWIESQIIQETNDYLSDPDYFISTWEEMTGEQMPEKYLKQLPYQIAAFLVKGKHKSRSGDVRVEILPVIDQKGNRICYPDDRLVSDFLPFDYKVYILKDSILKSISKR